ncbi:hypothetical protein SLS60_006051 [Paraconiothyrium brasiliense]|uniref:Uncharacterized protein n=1 Tax=Paraconiothyrium brasiliense TaxID=300254 RepID=A0ABR3RDW6_9PLEO
MKSFTIILTLSSALLAVSAALPIEKVALGTWTTPSSAPLSNPSVEDVKAEMVVKPKAYPVNKRAAFVSDYKGLDMGPWVRPSGGPLHNPTTGDAKAGMVIKPKIKPVTKRAADPILFDDDPFTDLMGGFDGEEEHEYGPRKPVGSAQGVA